MTVRHTSIWAAIDAGSSTMHAVAQAVIAHTGSWCRMPVPCRTEVARWGVQVGDFGQYCGVRGSQPCGGGVQQAQQEVDGDR
ncbi:hypothetical protein [Streptomyces sp. MBT33]|uniref:hypothetical protein n=1 Tax=Streptomyces sp. MBT33 TaxID=1488363 RepID=UPI00190CDCD2|nr:hypothetical protein [Streptomyces sp. MBT33]MBK3646533.1 hypothetical protein [Streptomyces sp. MBT33]